MSYARNVDLLSRLNRAEKREAIAVKALQQIRDFGQTKEADKPDSHLYEESIAERALLDIHAVES